MDKVEDQYNKELWFDGIDKDFTLKHKTHNWMKESEQESKLEKLSRRSTRSTSKSDSPKSSKSLKGLNYKKAIWNCIFL